MSGDASPTLSVVVAVLGGGPELERCLASLRGSPPGVEILVAGCLDAAAADALAERHPGTRVLRVPAEELDAGGDADSRVFALRSRGADAARGALVAFTEDHCVVGPRWASSLLESWRHGPAVLGGPVLPAEPGRARDRALYLCEYAALMPPLPEGEPPYLSAVNAAYPRTALLACRDTWERGFYDNEVLDAVRDGGLHCRQVPEAWVRSTLSLPPARARAHLRAGGRRYGRYRRTHQGLGPLYVAGLPLLPLLLGLRIARTVARRAPRRLGSLPLALPWLLLYLGSWSLGEAVGALAPPPSRGETG